MNIMYPFIAVCLAGFALLQASIGFIGYRRTGKKKLLLVSIAFFTFTLKGVYAILVAFAMVPWTTRPDQYMLVVDLFIVFLLYLSILKE